ncbi:hypothetical protein PQX77_021942 [Marasmius sp. AFHP31]|nr:hypothetical protein PQX77_021942 [Marasmius sp. AFHP31]
MPFFRAKSVVKLEEYAFAPGMGNGFVVAQHGLSFLKPNASSSSPLSSELKGGLTREKDGNGKGPFSTTSPTGDEGRGKRRELESGPSVISATSYFSFGPSRKMTLAHPFARKEAPVLDDHEYVNSNECLWNEGW